MIMINNLPRNLVPCFVSILIIMGGLHLVIVFQQSEDSYNNRIRFMNAYRINPSQTSGLILQRRLNSRDDLTSNHSHKIKAPRHSHTKIPPTKNIKHELGHIHIEIEPSSENKSAESSQNRKRISPFFTKNIRNSVGYLTNDPTNDPISELNNKIFPYQPKHLKVSLFGDEESPDLSYFHLTRGVINKLPVKIFLHNSNLCKLTGGHKRPYLLIIVPTVVTHFPERQAIRQTWGSVAHNGGRWGSFLLRDEVRLLFVLGASKFSQQQVEDLTFEADQFGDLLLSDFTDSYRNLTLKMSVSLAWVARYCNGVGHVIKVDEDTFLFVPKLISLLRNTEQTYNKFIMGFMHLNKYPKVLRKGRWGVKTSLYPLPSYPRYVYGHSYVISGAAIKTLLYALYRMPLVNNEDAFFTGILPVVTGVARLSHRTFAMVLRHEMECEVASGYFVSITSCCNIHLTKIFKAVQERKCHTYRMNEISAPGCRYKRKKPAEHNSTEVSTND